MNQMVRTALIEDNLRWELRRIWGTGGRFLTWLMLNPSTADADKDDPTLLRIIKWAKLWGYDGLIVVNLYPFRSPSPEEMKRWHSLGSFNAQLYARNVAHILQALADSNGAVVAAWGGSLPKPEGVPVFLRYIEHMARRERQLELTWRCLGVSKAGQPIHPMARGKNRIPDDHQLVPFMLNQTKE
jgi:hypothetical protein